MKLLMISNQMMADGGLGNPIMLRLRDAALADERIDEVKMLRCKNPLKVVKPLREMAKFVDVVHIHFGGAYAMMVWILLVGIRIPKVITFHGTDIHAKALKTAKSKGERFRIRLNQKMSFLSLRCFDRCGFVAEEMYYYIPRHTFKRENHKFFVQKLGVDYRLFSPIPIADAQTELNLPQGNYVLFSDVSHTSIKRRDLAESIIDLLPGRQLLVMCGVKPNEVPMYINAADFVLLTSDEEGSPNIIREALALNKPVFSVNVGDAAKQLDGLKNSAIIHRDPSIAATEIQEYLSKNYVDNTRDAKRKDIDFAMCNRAIVDIYEKIVVKQ